MNLRKAFSLMFFGLMLSIAGAAPKAQAGVGVDVSLFVNSFFNFFDHVNARSRLSLSFGGQYFDFHTVGYYDHFYGYQADLMYGGGFRFGDSLQIILEGGALQRSYTTSEDTLMGYGHFGTLALNYRLSKHLSFFIPVIVKQVSSGDLSKRLTTEVIPYLNIGRSL